MPRAAAEQYKLVRSDEMLVMSVMQVISVMPVKLTKQLVASRLGLAGYEISAITAEKTKRQIASNLTRIFATA